MSQPKFQCMIFDVGDILYDATYWRRWLTSAINQIGRLVTYEQLVLDWEKLLVPVYTGHLSYWLQFNNLLSKYGIPEKERTQLMTEARRQAQIAKAQRTPFPFVIETLSKLQANNTVLIALSDNESGEKGLRDTLMQLKAEEYFTAVISSYDLGFAKPHPKTFEAAIQASTILPERCVFVGHDIDELQGAKQFGLSTIAYNHTCETTADFSIVHFHELIAYQWKN